MTISGADDVMWRLLVRGRVFVVAFLTWTAAADTWFQPVTTSDLRLFEPAPGFKHPIAVEFCSLGLNLDVQSSYSLLVKLQFPLQHERQDRWTPPNFLFAPFSLPEDM